MWKKLQKSEVVVTIVGMIVALLAPKLGIPEEALSDLFMSIAAIVGVYIGGRSYAKPREMQNGNGNGNP